MIANECSTWRIVWGPGSIRPDHYMLYRCDTGEEYVGTYMTLSAAMREARRWEGQAIDDARVIDRIFGYPTMREAMRDVSENNNEPEEER